MKINSLSPTGATSDQEVWEQPDVRQSTVSSATTQWGATSELYQSSYRTMLRVAYSITGNRTAAEDAVHDAFCSVGPRIGTLDDPVPYLRVAVVNRCRTLHRSSERERQHVAEQVGGPALGYSPAADDGLADFGDALALLTFPQRTAIVMRYLCDLSDDEISDTLQCRRSTVRSHIRRGLATLRQELS